MWTWEIPVYFFTGGLAGASAGLAYLAGLRGNDVLARRAWAVALAAIAISPRAADLRSRPTRRGFSNMLRMFKVTSPMSVGLVDPVGQRRRHGAGRGQRLDRPVPARGAVARPAAALLGLPLSTYTAALIANTAVPVWHEARRELPFVFGAGAALSAGAAAVAVTPPEHAGPRAGWRWAAAAASSPARS